MKKALVLAFLAILSASALADVTMRYPQKQTAGDGATLQAGVVARGETFDLAFSDNSGKGYLWSSLSISQDTLPAGWQVVSTAVNDTSLVTKIRVPSYASPGAYPLRANLSGNGKSESVIVAVQLKENTIDISFSRESSNITKVGDKVTYKAVITNNSIAPETIVISSNLPSNWFLERKVELKPGSSQEVSLEVSPLTSGNHSFTFSAHSVQKGSVVKSFSSDLKVQPTLKGKLASMFSGFPIFTFTLLPFQLFDAYLSLLFY